MSNNDRSAVCRLLLLLGTGLLLAACDPMYGVRRTVALSHPLSAATVQKAVAAVPDVHLTGQSTIPPATSWALYRVERDRGGQSYAYYSEPVRAGGVIAVEETQAQGLTLSLYSFRHERFSPEELQRTRTLMDRIYLNLRRQDPSLPPPEQVHERASAARSSS